MAFVIESFNLPLNFKWLKQSYSIKIWFTKLLLIPNKAFCTVSATCSHSHALQPAGISYSVITSPCWEVPTNAECTVLGSASGNTVAQSFPKAEPKQKDGSKKSFWGPDKDFLLLLQLSWTIYIYNIQTCTDTCTVASSVTRAKQFLTQQAPQGLKVMQIQQQILP